MLAVVALPFGDSFDERLGRCEGLTAYQQAPSELRRTHTCIF